MSNNLVIVESPAKAKTIEKFLGSDFKVMSSFGHICDLQKKGLGIDIEKGFQPQYIISDDKKELVAKLKTAARKADVVWLASDEDREGEAIAWHLYDTLQLQDKDTRRIVFHEITKGAIEEAVKNPRSIDLNLVNAQQARRVLDRLVGFEISPILWKRIKTSLSAGRVQSVAVRLIVDREREIMRFQPESFYRLALVFTYVDAQGQEIRLEADLEDRIADKQQALDLLERLKTARFTVEDVTTRPVTRTPAPPFTTSTLQQEASRKLGLSISQTMRLAQSMYEAGKITYMRTDSVHLSSLAIGAARQEIEKTLGKEYHKVRQYQTRSKGAQEAHEAIRPAYINHPTIEGGAWEKRLYELIWKRTIASQMADAQLERTTITIGHDKGDEKFTAVGLRVVFDGFLRVYSAAGETKSDNSSDEEDTNLSLLPSVASGQVVALSQAKATERFTQHPFRYNEGSLVHKLEELGIGRPSTYAPIISNIQQRDYIERANREGVKRAYNVLELNAAGKLSDKSKTEVAGAEKAKLFPTDIGMVVTDFLLEHFPSVMDYQFTAKVEKQFDQVAEGKADWNRIIGRFYDGFHAEVNTAGQSSSKEKAGSRVLGEDPKSGRPVSVRIGRFGPIAQIGEAEDTEKPLFASLKKDQRIETITLEEALDLFKLPRQLGLFEEKKVTVGVGRFGPYVQHNGQYVSLPKSFDPMEVSLEEAIVLIQEKRAGEEKRLIKEFAQDAEMSLLRGRFGPYLKYQGKNYKLPKDAKAEELSYEACIDIIQKQAGQSAKPTAANTARPVKTAKATKEAKSAKATKTAKGAKPAKAGKTVKPAASSKAKK